MEVGKQLSGVPPNLYVFLEEDPEWVGISPLDEDAPEEIRIPCALNLDRRLNAINQKDSGSVGDLSATPEIRLEADDIPGTPEISVTAPENLSEETSAVPTTLVASRSFGIASDASRRHTSALVRLLYVHSCLNPAHRSPYIASLLVPLYSALNMEIEVQDVAHAEADSFWLFEAMISEFSPLEDEAEGALWMKKLGDRVWQADSEFYTDLVSCIYLPDDQQSTEREKACDGTRSKLTSLLIVSCFLGLIRNSSLYRCSRWLAPLLTHTLPLPCVLMAWDVLFSYPLRERDTNPKLDGLLDICAGMLLKSRWTLKRCVHWSVAGRESRLTQIFHRLVKTASSGQKSPSGLWDSGPQSQPGEFSEAFMEGMVFLQNYPVNAVGGMEAVLQAADDLTTMREAEARAAQAASTGVGARIRGAVWGFSGQPGSAVTMPALNVTNEPARPQEVLAGITDFAAGPSTLTSRLANTVWRGITNQSAMDEPTTPTTPSVSGSPHSPFPPSPQLLAQPFSPGPLSPLVLGSRMGTPEPLAIGANLWNYAEKLRDSDTAAKLSKASTNLRVMALDAWHKRGSPEDPHDHLDQNKANFTSDAFHTRKYSAQSEGSYFSREPSFSDADSTYTPPPRPSRFRPPRDSMFLDTKALSTPASPTLSAASELSASSTGSGRSISGGPKPLLLSTSTVISPANEGKRIWGHIARDSTSSTSSLSPTDYRSKRRTESLSWDSDTSKSRVVPLRRGTGKVSPAAIAAKLSRSRPDSTSSERSEYLGKLSEEPKPIVEAETQPPIPEEDHVNPPSPIHSPPPETPLSFITPVSEPVRVQDVEPQRGSLVLNNVLEESTPTRPSIRRKTRPTIDLPPRETTSASSIAGARIKPSLRVKPRRQLPQIQTAAGVPERTMGTSPNTLRLPEWPRGVEEAPTPRASDFEVAFPSSSPTRSPRSPRRPRKLSGDKETRPRKASGENREGTRLRKVSGETRKTSGGSVRRNRESSSIEGDDEGYDDLLSAYESEEGHHG